MPSRESSPLPSRRWPWIGYFGTIAVLAVFGVWPAVSVLIIVGFLFWFAKLAIAIPSTHRGWESPDAYVRWRDRANWLSTGLTSSFRSQLPRWMLFSAVILYWISLVERIRQAIDARYIVAGACVLAVASFVVAFTEPRST